MLTNPKEIVPLQMARGPLADSPLADVGVGVGVLRAVLSAIDNILNSVRAAGGIASGPAGSRLPRHLERVAQSVREPTRAGDAGRDLGSGNLAPCGGGRLARDRPPRTPPGRLAARARLGHPRADLFHHALDGLPAWRALGRLSHRPGHGAIAGRAGRSAVALRLAPVVLRRDLPQRVYGDSPGSGVTTHV